MTDKSTPKAEVVTDPKAAAKADEKPAEQPTTTQAQTEKAEAKAEAKEKGSTSKASADQAKQAQEAKAADQVQDEPTLAELQKQASEQDIEGRSSMNKAELAEALGVKGGSASRTRTTSAKAIGKAYREGNTEGEEGDADVSNIDKNAELIKSVEHNLAHRLTGDADVLDAKSSA